MRKFPDQGCSKLLWGRGVMTEGELPPLCTRMLFTFYITFFYFHSDKNARQLSQSGRSAVAEYLQILTGGDAKSKKINLKSDGSLHPSIQKSLDIINSKFDNLCIKDQDILGTPELWQKVLALINDESVRSKLHETFPSKKNSEERWQVLKTFASDVTLNEIKLQFAYPRLDINVSKGLNHLLKSPFCVHPKTGKEKIFTY